MNKNVVEKSLKHELLLHDLDTDSVHVLNRSARLVYELIRAGKDLSEVETSIRKRYRVPKAADIIGDLQACVLELEKKGLVTNINRIIP